MFTINRKSFFIRFALMFVLMIGIFNSVPIKPVLAATLTVTNTNDSGAGSLRQAIANANPGDIITFDSGLSGGIIHLISTLTLSQDVTINGSTLASHITMSGDDLYRVFYINSGVTVTLDSLIIAHGKSPYGSTGGGIFSAGALTITNSNISENSAAYGGGIFNEGGTVTMIDSTLSYNNAYQYGGGVYSQGGTVMVSNSTLSNNKASFVGGGFYNAGGAVTVSNSTFSYNSGDPLMSSAAGGIYNIGTLTIDDSTFSNNSALDEGGGIFHADGTLTITNSIFSGNSTSGYRSTGGGIINSGTLIITTSTFSGNSAESGGAIYNNVPLGMLTVTDSTFSGNSAIDGGGILNENTLTVTNSIFSGNSASDDFTGGGGISNYKTLTVTNSTFSGNSAYNWGGGIANFDTLIIMNSTFSGNKADIGGGIANSGYEAGVTPIPGMLTMKNTTFSANSAQHGGGVANFFISNSTLNYANTIIANSTSGGDCYNVRVIGTNIKNLVEDASCSASMDGDPNLAPLADNGGPTQTMKLLTGSPAIDAGDDANCPSTDQRGIARPQGSHCDIGAYEVVTDATPPTITSIVRASANPTSAASVKFNVTFSEPVTDVSTSDFALNTTGTVAGSTIQEVSGSDALYAVTVNTGSGYGTLRLDVSSTATINDLAGNPLGSLPFTSGEVYTLARNNGADTTGVFRPSNGVIFLKNSNTTGFADVGLNYGIPGDYPVVGDWDGDGTVTIGVYRNGQFLLRNSNTVGFAEVVFPFGQPGDQPIAGDWNGDGIDTIGVYRPSNGQFLLRNSNSAGTADASFYLGNVGDVGIAGDWNGDGIDTTGVFRPSNGVIFLKDKNETGFADVALNYGIPGDKPVTGDWDNDGVDTIGVYRNGQFMLRNENTNGFAEIVFGLGNPGDMPIAGNWDGLP